MGVSGTVISFDEALQAASEGNTSREAASALMRAKPGAEFDLLMNQAGRLRDRLKGRIITYSRKVFLPLTNLCRDYCGYCTFRKDPDEPGARTMSPEEVLEVVEAGDRLGCKEALFSLGDRPEAAFREMRDQLRGHGHKATPSDLAATSRRALEDNAPFPDSNAGLTHQM